MYIYITYTAVFALFFHLPSIQQMFHVKHFLIHLQTISYSFMFHVKHRTSVKY